jgi:pimeloyl-ACP methyl ester carboxylesterase
VSASTQLAVHRFGPERPGERRPVVLLHGAPGKLSYFSPLIEALSATRQVLFVDMPGYGAVRKGQAEEHGFSARVLYKRNVQ